jgi:CO/xanthine dehydrogenase FAD-binding subunit
MPEEASVWDVFVTAASVADALHQLADLQGEGRIIAGGTDLVLQAQRGSCPSRAMVDVTRIPELDRIETRDGFVVIGATVTHARIAGSSIICSQAPLLAQACGSIGGPQIRNVGTLVGNVVNALPAADGAVALFALDAEVEVADLDGRRWLPIAELYEDVGVCAIDPCAQMVTALRFRSPAAHLGSDFQRLARRRALALPIVNVGAVVGVHNGCFTDARIAVGPVAPRPFRASEAEQLLIGQPVAGELIAQAAVAAASSARPRPSLLRGSPEYRTAMVEVLVRRALANASAQAVAA